MARGPNEEQITAHNMYKKGMKLVDIANKLGKPQGTIRRWKSTYKWGGDTSERSEKKANKKSERSGKTKQNKCIDSKAVNDAVNDVMENDELTEKQRLFCLYYDKSKNATQSYQKAYGCKYVSAMQNGSRLLRNVKVRQEIDRLKRIKMESIMVGEDDIVELKMRIAFSDIGDYLRFGQKEIELLDPNGLPALDDNGDQKTIKVNRVELNESDLVDTQLIKEIKQGKDGISIKLEDRSKAQDWLAQYFLMNPMDKHKLEYDNKRLAMMNKSDDDSEEIADDGFLEALNGSAKEDWNDEQE